MQYLIGFLLGAGCLLASMGLPFARAYLKRRAQVERVGATWSSLLGKLQQIDDTLTQFESDERWAIERDLLSAIKDTIGYSTSRVLWSLNPDLPQVLEEFAESLNRKLEAIRPDNNLQPVAKV